MSQIVQQLLVQSLILHKYSGSSPKHKNSLESCDPNIGSSCSEDQSRRKNSCLFRAMLFGQKPGRSQSQRSSPS
jgi:hypothetical protein